MNYSRHYLTDLQVHSPADPAQKYGDWTGREDEVARRIVEAHLDAGVEVIALTDHLELSWYQRIAESAEVVEEDTGRRLFVFPGFEVSANGCHLILIWDRTDAGFETATRHLAGLFPANKDLRVRNEFRPLDDHPAKVAKAAVETGAVVIAPHATKSRMGAFASGVVSNLGDLVANDHVSAWDVHGDKNNGVLTGPKQHFGDRVPAWICTGDVRSYGEAGKRAVWLKMDSPPTLNGLRHAFVAPQTRIRFPRHLHAKYGDIRHVRYADTVEPSCARLTRITVRGGFHDGLDVHLAPGLNAVIGGRGTGKSALIEIVRYGLGMDDPNVERLVENRERNLPANADVAIEFVTADGDRYRAERPGGGLGRPVVHRDDGTRTDVDVHDRLQPNVFGQTQLHDLARSDNLRDFLIRQAGEAWTSLARNEAERLRKMDRVSAEMAGVEASAGSLEEKEAELGNLRDRLKNAETQHAADKIAELDVLATTEQALEEVEAWPNAVEEAVRSLGTAGLEPTVPAGPAIPDTLGAAVVELSQKVEDAVAAITAATEAARETIDAAIGEWNEWADTTRQKITAALSAVGIDRPEQLGADQRRAARLDSEVSALQQSADTLAGHQDDWDEHVRQLRIGRRAKSRLLEQTAERLNASLGGGAVRIRFKAMSDTSLLDIGLFALTRGVNRSTVSRAAEASGGPERLVGLLRSARQSRADHGTEVDKATKDLTELGLTSTAIDQLLAVGDADVRGIETADVPDLVSLEMNLGTPDDPVWQDAKAMSPGQAATALLALVMVSGSEPLIVDQPEEDLDNRFVFNEVVSQLTETCDRRQVIVVTHDANIPVVGDAELIVALDAEQNRGRILAYGGLEDPDVARHARDILEGGQEAFDERLRRYPPR